jgi:hypothetical protein
MIERIYKEEHNQWIKQMMLKTLVTWRKDREISSTVISVTGINQ